MSNRVFPSRLQLNLGGQHNSIPDEEWVSARNANPFFYDESLK
ncbi:hypothetical protein [[Phormidium ambiguum] IAM M-71]|nr:hypothetical protein [Phormidium ambiguum]